MSQLSTILLVDDDADDLMMLREAIESLEEKFIVEECHDGRSALNYLKQKQGHELPCLIVLDINMPILDGREMLAILKGDLSLKRIPVVVFTTSSNPADISYCAQFNVDLVTKPFNISMLETIAKRLITYCDV